MSERTTVANLLVTKLKTLGVKVIYGLPGGGSSLDIISAAHEQGIEFVLTKTENAAVMMAGAIAETTGIPGVALMTKGPGVTNAANGVAYASLDRAPVIVLTDGFTPQQLSYITHQVFDQSAVLRPLVKAHSRLESEDPGAEIDTLFAALQTKPLGPVHIELTSQTAKKQIPTPSHETDNKPAIDKLVVGPDRQAIDQFRARLQQARKPVVILGLESRYCEPEIHRLLDGVACAILTTYKAKGVIADTDPRVVGIFTGGALEAAAVAAADLMVLVGLDPVELILQPWSYATPVVEISAFAHPVHYVKPSLSLIGPMSDILSQLTHEDCWTHTGWERQELASLRNNALSQLTYQKVERGVAPDRIAQIAADVCAQAEIKPMFSIDAGAHMFSVAAFFPAAKAGDVLISNGLATMAFALPAAIAAAVDDRSRPVLCFTGDGGLMMCLGELCTAVEQKARTIIIVFNDSALSLIDIKQQSRQLESRGVRWSQHDFAATMRGLGGDGEVVSSEAAFVTALNRALNATGPYLIDVLVDPSGYSSQLKAMRG